MVALPRLHKKLGANWVEVTKAVFMGISQNDLRV